MPPRGYGRGYGDTPYNHIFGAMSQYDGLRIASAIRGGYWDSALMWLKESTGWTGWRSKSFLNRYKDWARLDGQISAAEQFMEENFVDKMDNTYLYSNRPIFDDFITADEMEIC